MRISDFGLRISDFGMRIKRRNRGSTSSPQANHGPRILGAERRSARGGTNHAKAPAPNEPTASQTQGQDNETSKSPKGEGAKGLRIQWFGEMRNADFGLRNGDQEKESRFDRRTEDESRTTGHESRKSLLAKRTHGRRKRNADNEMGWK